MSDFLIRFAERASGRLPVLAPRRLRFDSANAHFELGGGLWSSASHLEPMPRAQGRSVLTHQANNNDLPFDDPEGDDPFRIARGREVESQPESQPESQIDSELDSQFSDEFVGKPDNQPSAVQPILHEASKPVVSEPTEAGFRDNPSALESAQMTEPAVLTPRSPVPLPGPVETSEPEAQRIVSDKEATEPSLTSVPTRPTPAIGTPELVVGTPSTGLAPSDDDPGASVTDSLDTTVTPTGIERSASPSLVPHPDRIAPTAIASQASTPGEPEQVDSDIALLTPASTGNVASQSVQTSTWTGSPQPVQTRAWSPETPSVPTSSQSEESTSVPTSTWSTAHEPVETSTWTATDASEPDLASEQTITDDLAFAANESEIVQADGTRTEIPAPLQPIVPLPSEPSISVPTGVDDVDSHSQKPDFQLTPSDPEPVVPEQSSNFLETPRETGPSGIQPEPTLAEPADIAKPKPPSNPINGDNTGADEPASSFESSDTALAVPGEPIVEPLPRGSRDAPITGAESIQGRDSVEPEIFDRNPIEPDNPAVATASEPSPSVLVPAATRRGALGSLEQGAEPTRLEGEPSNPAASASAMPERTRIEASHAAVWRHTRASRRITI